MYHFLLFSYTLFYWQVNFQALTDNNFIHFSLGNTYKCDVPVSYLKFIY